MAHVEKRFHVLGFIDEKWIVWIGDFKYITYANIRPQILSYNIFLFHLLIFIGDSHNYENLTLFY
ncbi:hypothetical protein D2V93_04850 [Flagellimonas taeanensis]|nr:hypothetical protein D2V93_04850 [Allomuricauda taeanensis]